MNLIEVLVLKTGKGQPRAQGCAGAAIARLAALVPKPRVNLTRFHGVFVPNSKHRALVTPAKRGKGSKLKVPDEAQDQTPAERRAAMTGFCSCKTGIPSIHGHNLGTKIKACLQYRPLSHIRVLRGISESVHVTSRLAGNAAAP
jgi:hypothetical protein